MSRNYLSLMEIWPYKTTVYLQSRVTFFLSFLKALNKNPWSHLSWRWQIWEGCLVVYMSGILFLFEGGSLCPRHSFEANTDWFPLYNWSLKLVPCSLRDADVWREYWFPGLDWPEKYNHYSFFAQNICSTFAW